MFIPGKLFVLSINEGAQVLKLPSESLLNVLISSGEKMEKRFVLNRKCKNLEGKF
jgi:hypothetical protein